MGPKSQKERSAIGAIDGSRRTFAPHSVIRRRGRRSGTRPGLEISPMPAPLRCMLRNHATPRGISPMLKGFVFVIVGTYVIGLLVSTAIYLMEHGGGGFTKLPVLTALEQAIGWPGQFGRYIGF